MIKHIITPEKRDRSERASCIFSLLAGLICLVGAGWASAADKELHGSVENQMLTTDLLPSELVKDPYTFSGLASYFNNVDFLILDDASVKKLKENETEFYQLYKDLYIKAFS